MEHIGRGPARGSVGSAGSVSAASGAGLVAAGGTRSHVSRVRVCVCGSGWL